MTISKETQDMIDSLSGRELINLLQERSNRLYDKGILPTPNQIRKKKKNENLVLLLIFILLLITFSMTNIVIIYITLISSIALFLSLIFPSQRKLFDHKRILRICDLEREMGIYFY